MNNSNSESVTVTVLGMGAVGHPVAYAIAQGQLPGLVLKSIATSSAVNTERHIEEIHALSDLSLPTAVTPARLSDGDTLGQIVVECLPPAFFKEIAECIIRSRRHLLAASVGGLLRNSYLIPLAQQMGVRLLLPSGAIGGLDAVRAMAVDQSAQVHLSTEKPLSGFEQNEYLTQQGIKLSSVSEKTKLFSGNAADGIKHFPKNVNVVAALAFAGVGPERTQLSLWADPLRRFNKHSVSVKSASAELTALTLNLPHPDNPKTSALTSQSVIAALRNYKSTLTFI